MIQTGHDACGVRDPAPGEFLPTLPVAPDRRHHPLLQTQHH